MDQATGNYYARHAAEVTARYRLVATRACQQKFAEAFGRNGKVVDVGCGSGRDVAVLLEMGFDAYGFEPVAEMHAECVRSYPQLAGRILECGLPLPAEAELEGQYDGVLCSAVFMHVPEAERFDAAFSLKRLLREKGRLLISVPAARPGLDADNRDEMGRLFQPVHGEYLVLLFERLGLHLVRRWEESDKLGREDIHWNTFLFELDSTRGRSLDRIERVINRDAKDATYKLALFRALSEIGTTQDRQAEWLNGGEVALPIRLIAEKWFRYYWPIFEGKEFIPQKNGERPGSAKPVAFRQAQMEIIEACRAGGLSQFLADAAAGELPAAVAKQYQEVLKTIAATIKDGPVVYASGEMFRYDKQRKAVVIEGTAWREFCQLGHWIEPAVVLRWAEETHRMAKGNVTVAEALNRLVVNPTEERNVGAAKEVFDAMTEKRCVWSDKRLGVKYAVDHVIPYSLWHCNALWNLLPSDAVVNGKKSDRLPEHGLLQERKDTMVYYWQQLRAQHPRRFDWEAGQFVGQGKLGDNWENATFQRIVEAVETTASQRGAERWRP